jgi:hypothetical protein
MAFYELRQYKVRPGMLEGWVKIMEEEIIPFQVSKGMVITGSFQGETDPSVLTTPLINTLRHYTKPRVRENNGCWSSSRVNASISGCNQRSGIVGIRS